MKLSVKPIFFALSAFGLVLFVPMLFDFAGPSCSADFEGVMDRGPVIAFGVVFLGGILTSLTPCVYPLIPVTIAIFGGGSSEGRLRSMALSTFYVMGMALMYAGMGLAAALTGRLLGSVMTSIWLMGAVSLLFFIFAFSFLGLFEFRLPGGLNGYLSRTGGRGFSGAFTMGLAAGLIAAPCTGPVLGGVLAYVAISRDLIFGASLLFIFALGMGVLFWLIGAFSLNLPKSGPWMEYIRGIFAVVLLVAGLWFLKDALPVIRMIFSHSVHVPWLTAAAVAAGILAGGIHRKFHDPGFLNRFLKASGLLLIAGGIFLRLGSLSTVHPDDISAIDWHDYDSESFRELLEKEKPVIIDFRADWCTACIDLERRTFPHPLVAEEAGRFLFVKVDASDDTLPEIREILNDYSVRGLPTVIFLNSQGLEILNLRVEKFVSPSEMRRRMNAVH